MRFGFCLFGAGRIGRIHAANLARHPQARLEYVIDIDQAAAEQLAERHGARAGHSAAVLGEAAVDAAVIASSTDTHQVLIAACAAAGKAVLCEKPLDLDLERARASLATAKAAAVPLYLGFNRRYDPSFRRLKNEIATGTLGRVEIVSITSRDPAPPPIDYLRRSGGLFRDMMIHDLDMARWLLGEEPVSVYATGGCLIDPAIGEAGDIDTAVVVLRAASGALCQISNSRRCSYGYDQRIEVFGSSAMARADNDTATRVELADSTGFTREPALPFFLERYAAAYRLELDDFVRALAGQRVPLADGHDGLRALLLAEAAERSLREGRAVAPGE